MRTMLPCIVGLVTAGLGLSGCAFGVVDEGSWTDGTALASTGIGGLGAGGNGSGGTGPGAAAPGGGAQAGAGQGGEGLGSTTGGGGPGAGAPGGGGTGGTGSGGTGSGGAAQGGAPQGGSGAGGGGPLDAAQLCGDACQYLTMCGSISPSCQSVCEFDLMGCTSPELDEFAVCYQTHAPVCAVLTQWQLCITAIACVDG